MRLLLIIIVVAGSALMTGCEKDTASLSIPYEKYSLSNGLEVILHEDTSDPIVSVAVQYHVGSNRETPGKTGFAHLFEHMMFQESQNVGQDQFFQKIQEAGGTLNGGTGQDGTVYYEVLPKNVLEMALWMESDRMGYLLSTVTPEAFANQQEVVINEKKQRVDNQPYGNTWYILGKLMYPPSHPYSWQTIGSMPDLTDATVADIQKFHKKWYVPNNATLVVAGDFDRNQAKQWIQKYFGDIKPSDSVLNPAPAPAELSESRRAWYEDPFAKSPQLSLVFPTVEQFNEDSYALDYLADLLSNGKEAPLYQVLVEGKKLAPAIGAYSSGSELAGSFMISSRTFPSTSLDDVEQAIQEAFRRFEQNGFTDEQLDRIKTRTETSFYNGLASLLSKSFRMAFYNEYAGSPDFVREDLERALSVSKDDIWRVYNTYIKDKPFVLLSVVPQGMTNLAARNSTRFVVEPDPALDKSVLGQPGEGMQSISAIPSSFDRSVEPPAGPSPLLALPHIWQADLPNGLPLYGITQTELPLVQFTITIEGGQLLENTNAVGVANLTAALMNEGTRSKTPLELENAIKDLGASLYVSAGRDSISLQGSCLASKFDAVSKLAAEMLLEPRSDAKEFERIKQQTIEGIKRSRANPDDIANRVFNRLLYGPDHVFGYSASGSEVSVAGISLDDCIAYYNANLSPSEAYIAIAGDITKPHAVRAFSPLAEHWSPRQVTIPNPPLPKPPAEPKVYFVDFSGAKQSIIKVGYLALPYTDPDYYPAYVMNFKLGGTFNSRLNTILREEKGYTYGAGSGFSGSKIPGPFSAGSSVISRATPDSVSIFRDTLASYPADISSNDLYATKSALLKSNARRFETLGALCGMLNTIAKYHLPLDYIKDQEAILTAMTTDQLQSLAKEYIVPEKLSYLIVGDAATQLDLLKDLGLGDPVAIKDVD